MGALPLSLISSLLAGEATEWAGSIRRKIMGNLVAGLLGLGAYGALIAAAAVAIGEELGLLAGLLTVAAILAASAVAVLLVLRYVERRHKKRQRHHQPRTDIYLAAAAAALPFILRSRTLALMAVGAGGVAWALSRQNGGERKAAEYQRTHNTRR